MSSVKEFTGYDLISEKEEEVIVEEIIEEKKEDSIKEIEKEDDVNVVVLTASKTIDQLSETVENIKLSCEKLKLKFIPVLIDYAIITGYDSEKNYITIHNYNNENKSIELYVKDSVIIVRGGAISSMSGDSIAMSLQERGFFMINTVEHMKKCFNKLTSSIIFDTHNISTPSTCFVNEKNIDTALEKVGGKFPIVLKTITGAEGIGVSIVESYDSYKSVLQSLWKYGAEIIVQEHMKIENDVRTLVLDGKIIASTKRVKNEDSGFRTNKAQGATVEAYELSEEEKEFIMNVSKSFGGYYIGVDHVVVDKKIYCLEVNGSPGSGSKYAKYWDDQFGAVNGKELIKHFVSYISDRGNWKYPYKEVGREEYITIDEVGTFKCKMDTGNGTHNVIHAKDIKEKDGKVTFTTMDDNTLTKDIVDDVNIKANITDPDKKLEHIKRSVVAFDVEFDGRKYIDVLFSLDDRDGMNYPILTGTKFLNLTKKCVNVSKKFITHHKQNINNIIKEK